MIGSEVKLMDIFKLFLKNTSKQNCGYLFDWIRKCIKDPSVDKEELTDEITKNIDRLVTSLHQGCVEQGTGQKCGHEASKSGP